MEQLTSQQINELREKAKNGTLTRVEMRQAIEVLRADRLRAGEWSAKAKTKKQKAADVDSDALLRELGDLGI